MHVDSPSLNDLISTTSKNQQSQWLPRVSRGTDDGSRNRTRRKSKEKRLETARARGPEMNGLNANGLVLDWIESVWMGSERHGISDSGGALNGWTRECRLRLDHCTNQLDDIKESRRLRGSKRWNWDRHRELELSVDMVIFTTRRLFRVVLDIDFRQDRATGYGRRNWTSTIQNWNRKDQCLFHLRTGRLWKVRMIPSVEILGSLLARNRYHSSLPFGTF